MPDWPKFCILGEILVKILQKLKTGDFIGQNLLIWAEIVKR